MSTVTHKAGLSVMSPCPVVAAVGRRPTACPHSARCRYGPPETAATRPSRSPPAGGGIRHRPDPCQTVHAIISLTSAHATAQDLARLVRENWSTEAPCTRHTAKDRMRQPAGITDKKTCNLAARLIIREYIQKGARDTLRPRSSAGHCRGRRRQATLVFRKGCLLF